MLDIATTSASVKPPIGDGLNCVNPSISEKVRIGQEAMARKRRGWADWIAIGEALQVGRAEVMHNAHTNQPTGRRYERAMADWLDANGFNEIDKGVRSRLLECLQHRTEIDQWLLLLTDGERFRFNHPNTVLKRWKAATAVPDPNARPKPSPFAELKIAHAELIEEHHRLAREIEAGGGDLWAAEDSADDIARVMVGKLSVYKAEKVARAILAQLKERKMKEETI